MNVLICYYSGSGNTKLACSYIVKRIPEIGFDFYNITKDKDLSFDEYGAIGFATFTDFRGSPYLMNSFIKTLSPRPEMPAFVFTTHGFFSGKMPRCLADRLNERGFNVFTGYSLHTPQNYPPLVAFGFGNINAPNKREMRNFEIFISKLRKQLIALNEGKTIKKEKIKMGLMNHLSPIQSRTTARRSMGVGNKS
jgi:flavodoxin